MLKGKTSGARLSVEEINDAIADAGHAVGAVGVKITADTNVLLRALVGDDQVQQQMTIATGWVVKICVIFDNRAISVVRQQARPSPAT